MKNAICSNMDETRDYQTNWSKSETKTNTIWYHMWNLKYDTNELIYKTDSHTESRLVVAKGEGGGRDGLGVSD